MKIGVDLGGTNVRAGIEINGSIHHRNNALLTDKHSLSNTLLQLIEMIKPLIKPDVKGIGIGVPSVVDVEKGIVFDVVNIPSWKRVPLKDILEKEFSLPVYINNDVNCFVLGEHRFGAVKGFRTVVGMSAGTGLGAGIIINNQLFSGNNCGAGEIGLINYLDHNIEYYASGNLFGAFHHTTAAQSHEEAVKGDLHALELWKEFGFHLGQAVKTVVYAYDPEAIVIGGSLAKAFPFFEKAMHDALQDFSYPQSIKRLKIFQSQNENIPLLGAAALVK